jgi:hypothetical protein
LARSSASPSIHRITSGSRIALDAAAERDAIVLAAAPPVLEFDQQGNLVSSWGGPGAGYEWPQLEHGIYVDDRDHVWLGGGGEKDAQILKFTRQGRFVMQIGRQGQGRGSNDTQNLGAPRTWSSTATPTSSTSPTAT